MSAFGENLRREREMRGVSLDEISSATKISIRFLEAIEREDFSKLPGGIFSRSFIRSYARYLGLDEERTLAEFQASARPQMEFDLHRMAAGNTSAPRPTTRTPVVATLVALVLLTGGYLLFRYSRRAAEAPVPPAPAAAPPSSATAPAAPPTPSDATPVPIVNPSAGQPATGGTPGATSSGAVSGTSAVPGTTPPTTSGATPTNAAGGETSQAGATGAPSASPQSSAPQEAKPGGSDLALQVAATERAWVAVDADGKTVLQRVLNPGEVQNLTAHRSFDVTTGNAEGVILTLNGNTLKPLGRRGEVKTVHLNREDLKATVP